MFSKLTNLIINHAAGILAVQNMVQEGSVVVQAGEHAVEVTTVKDPVEVHLTWIGQGNMAVCQGGLDYFSYTIVPSGFILYVNSVSDYVQVGWTAKF
jgi:hypothetical protein